MRNYIFEVVAVAIIVLVLLYGWTATTNWAEEGTKLDTSTTSEPLPLNQE